MSCISHDRVIFCRLCTFLDVRRFKDKKRFSKRNARNSMQFCTFAIMDAWGGKYIPYRIRCTDAIITSNDKQNTNYLKTIKVKPRNFIRTADKIQLILKGTPPTLSTKLKASEN
ncbi:hypothetical protein CUMW_027510 [Citrus unshiu]|nr:hypothetical protein CUMW_027510 [Citrus unshiu]GAY37235.1 hypothetical protein CUMW_027510 [Citrus unshiu]